MIKTIGNITRVDEFEEKGYISAKIFFPSASGDDKQRIRNLRLTGRNVPILIDDEPKVKAIKKPVSKKKRK